MTQTTVTLVTTVVNHGFVATPLVTTQTLKRFRRDVLEGTQEELMLETVETESRDNSTLSERIKRQAEFPGNPEDDDSKSVMRYLLRSREHFMAAELTCASPRPR